MILIRDTGNLQCRFPVHCDYTLRNKDAQCLHVPHTLLPYYGNNWNQSNDELTISVSYWNILYKCKFVKSLILGSSKGSKSLNHNSMDNCYRFTNNFFSAALKETLKTKINANTNSFLILNKLPKTFQLSYIGPTIKKYSLVCHFSYEEEKLFTGSKLF